MTKHSMVSIIIVNWNGGKVFEKCLDSLKLITYPNWELIIVDNGSTDGTEKHATIKNRTNFGFATANNQGYAKSKGEYILLLNSDTVIEKDLLDKLVGRVEKESDIGIIQPKIKVMDSPQFLDNAGSFLTRIGFLSHWGFMKKDGDEFMSEKDVFSTKGACMMIKKEVIEQIGLFDEDFMSYFEESDLCWRSWLIGFRSLYYPNVAIKHKVGFTIRRLDVADFNWHYYKNRICSMIKNLNGLNLLKILPAHLTISLGIAFLFLLKGQFKNSAFIIRAIWWNIVNLPETIQKRKRIQKSRRLSDKFIFQKLSVPVDWKAFFADFQRVERDLKLIAR